MDAEKVFDAVTDVMRGPMAWGLSDCCTSSADVFLRLWGVDPMGGWRGAFRSRKDAVLAIYAIRKSMRKVCFDQAWEAGLREMDEHSGAIGLVNAVPNAPDQIDHVAAAICIRPGEWARRTQDGFTFAKDPLLVMGVK